MKLINQDTLVELELPSGLIWTDEFEWTRAVSAQEYALNGALIVQGGNKLKGRPITLEPADDEMGWMTRDNVLKVQELAELFNTPLTLVMGEGDSERQFNVRFRHNETAFEAEPVYRWQPIEPESYYLPTLRLIEV